MNEDQIKVCCPGVEGLVTILRQHRFHFQHEKDLQDGIAQVLSEKKVWFEREREIAPGCKIDFLVSALVGIEVKVDGSPSAVTRQLYRYARSPVIHDLILVTSRVKLACGLPTRMADKGLWVVPLWEAAL